MYYLRLSLPSGQLQHFKRCSGLYLSNSYIWWNMWKLELNVGVRFQHWFPPRGFGMSSVYTAAWPSILLQSEINYEIDIAGMRGMNSSCSGGVVGSGELLDSSQVAVSRCRLTEERISQYAVVELQRTLHHCCCGCGYYRCCRCFKAAAAICLMQPGTAAAARQAGSGGDCWRYLTFSTHLSGRKDENEKGGNHVVFYTMAGCVRACVRGVGGAPLQHTARTPYSSSWLHHRLLLLLLLLPGSSSHSLEWP